MKLDERRWVQGGGLTREWAYVGEGRRRQALAGLSAARKAAAKRAPKECRPLLAALDYLLKAKGPARDRVLGEPALDYWLFLWDKHFAAGLEASIQDWRLQLGLLAGFAGGLAVSRKDSLDVEGVFDPNGRLYLHGTPFYLEGTGTVRVKVARGKPAGELKRLPEAAPGIVVDDGGWLLLHGVTMHGLAKPSDEERAKFAAVLGRALSDMKERDPLLHEEMTDWLRALVPLQNPMNHGSVSSSYVNLRGLIALSHSDDALLQAETLIHEFCHGKMNQLLAVDPLLLPGQSGQVFYSPWRDDARRLRGLLLGAHAFLNVALYLSRSLSREKAEEEDAIEIMVNVSRRALQVETALRSLGFYAKFTELGRRFHLELWRQLGRLQHSILWFPPALVAEQHAECADHKKKWALYDTGFHRSAQLEDKVRRVAFLAPKEPEDPAVVPA